MLNVLVPVLLCGSSYLSDRAILDDVEENKVRQPEIFKRISLKSSNG